jgi:hypothetical protein
LGSYPQLPRLVTSIGYPGRVVDPPPWLSAEHASQPVGALQRREPLLRHRHSGGKGELGWLTPVNTAHRRQIDATPTAAQPPGRVNALRRGSQPQRAREVSGIDPRDIGPARQQGINDQISRPVLRLRDYQHDVAVHSSSIST